ncbi:NlpC/P60 family protein [Yoonia sp.]|uniref:NlpC/P60 family protein n=1 Tax=Yoonia sp. TaxID=2212373 RepID=UPI0035C8501F
MSADAVALARRWLGTPYLHQAALKDVGCDCAGLVRGVWAELYGAPFPEVPVYTPDWFEPQGADGLLAILQRHFRAAPVAPLRHGRLVAFRMRSGAIAKHLGFVTTDGPDLRFIHAYSGHGVVESPLSAPWRRRIAAQFYFEKGE